MNLLPVAPSKGTLAEPSETDPGTGFAEAIAAALGAALAPAGPTPQVPQAQEEAFPGVAGGVVASSGPVPPPIATVPLGEAVASGIPERPAAAAVEPSASLASSGTQGQSRLGAVVRTDDEIAEGATPGSQDVTPAARAAVGPRQDTDPDPDAASSPHPDAAATAGEVAHPVPTGHQHAVVADADAHRPVSSTSSSVADRPEGTEAMVGGDEAVPPGMAPLLPEPAPRPARGLDERNRPAGPSTAPQDLSAVEAAPERGPSGTSSGEPGPVSSGVLHRIEETIRRLEAGPPPRSITLDLEELGIGKLAVRLTSDGVRLAGADGATLPGSLLHDLEQALSSRGFDLAGDRRGRERGEERPEHGTAWAPPMPRPGRPGADHALRL